MRVLAIGNRYPPAGRGGYERIFAATVGALRAAGHDVRVLTTRDEDAGDAQTAADGVHRELRWYWRDGDFEDVGLREALRRERHNAAALERQLDWRPDVVCWWGMGGMSLSLIEQVARAGVPAVGVVGDGWMVYGPGADVWTAAWRGRPRVLAGLVSRLSGVPTQPDIGRAARWLFIAELVRERALAEGHQLPLTGIAHPGVDASRFPARPHQPWRGRLAVVGRVAPEKGVQTAIEALTHLPDAQLTVDGEGSANHTAELQALAERLGVADRLTFQSSAADAVAAAYAAADAVLFPVTWPEPWGLVPLEAMSSARPVIATGTGGSAEYLADQENALLFAPGDARALAAAVVRLAADPELRERLVAGGLRTAARYSQPAFEAAVVAELEQAAQGVGANTR